MFVLVNDYEPNDRRTLRATNLDDAYKEAIEVLLWKIVEVPDQKKLMKASKMDADMGRILNKMEQEKFVELHNAWFNTNITIDDIDWDE